MLSGRPQSMRESTSIIPRRGERPLTRMRSCVSALTCFLISLIVVFYFSESLLLIPLEMRFPRWEKMPGEPIVGILVLGGFLLDSQVNERPDKLSNISARMIETARLSQLYPNAKILYSGGANEAESGRKLLMQLGVASDRIFIENQSRTTAQNAKFSKIVVSAKISEKWILVTSAYHMPRAVGAFRAAGFTVEAYPVDFLKPEEGREYMKVALREYIALIAYWLSGKSNELFPSP